MKNIGSAVALCHYNSLGIERVLRNRARASKARYDINAVMRLLVIDRILSPGSKLSAFMEKDSYFFRSKFKEDDVYRALDFIASAKDSIISAINKSVFRSYGASPKNIFYDVTNYYFEIDQETDLKRRGVSKEHRPKPILAMGLAQDSRGIPLTYRLYEGNTLDFKTLLPTIKSIKDEFDLTHIVVVADKGINCSKNLAALVATKNGYVFSQSIRGTKSTEELVRWVVSESGWSSVIDKDGDTSFKLKSRQDKKTITIDGELNQKTNKPKKIKLEVDTKTVAFWSAKYAARSALERERVIAKSRELIKDPSAWTRATSYGAAKYVKNISFDKDTGEVIKDFGKQAVLDEDRISAEAALDGYYVIITSETDMPDSEIVDTYQELWKIEESFKITKSCLNARPVFLSTRSHIEAHFLVCYIALVIIRLIQLTTNYAYSAEAISDELSKLVGVHLEDNWWRVAYRSHATDDLCRSVGVDLTKKNLRLEEIKKILAKVNSK
jgi:transposase